MQHFLIESGKDDKPPIPVTFSLEKGEDNTGGQYIRLEANGIPILAIYGGRDDDGRPVKGYITRNIYYCLQLEKMGFSITDQSVSIQKVGAPHEYY